MVSEYGKNSESGIWKTETKKYALEINELNWATAHNVFKVAYQ